MNDTFTDDELDELFGPMTLYGSDKQIIINTSSSDTLITKLDKYCEENNYIWDYSDSTIEDDNMNIAYQSDVFGNYPDVIFVECDVFGKAGFDDGTYSWEDISSEFINNSSRALPKWFSVSQLESDSFELQSCDFANGWYDRHDDPKAISKKAIDNGYDIVFQINYYHQFECSFCVWTRTNK